MKVLQNFMGNLKNMKTFCRQRRLHHPHNRQSPIKYPKRSNFYIKLSITYFEEASLLIYYQCNTSYGRNETLVFSSPLFWFLRQNIRSTAKFIPYVWGISKNSLSPLTRPLVLHPHKR